MINISIESFKLLLNEINQIENNNFFIIIIRDALLSIGASNEEIANQDLHLCDTDTDFFYFFSLIDGCLKYKNKEKRKIGPKPGPGFKCRALLLWLILYRVYHDRA